MLLFQPMARTKKTKTTTKTKSSFFHFSQRQKIIFGSFLFFLGLALFISFLSYVWTWQTDQSTIDQVFNREIPAKNIMSKFGAYLGHVFIYLGVGIAAFNLSILIMLSGAQLFLNLKSFGLVEKWFWGLYLMFVFSLGFGFFASTYPILGGMVGFEINDLAVDYIGKTGTILAISFLVLIYLVVRLKLTPQHLTNKFKSKNIKEDLNELKSEPENKTKPVSSEETKVEEEFVKKEDLKDNSNDVDFENSFEINQSESKSDIKSTDSKQHAEVKMEVEATAEEEDEIDEKSAKIVEDFGEFDPTLELKNFKFPTLDLLKNYTEGSGITIDEKELEQNKNKIVETLNNYKIGIAQIKATVGPTVTLYEIIPDAGIRISKIRNLEDDIALSLSALGIRIIAPIPGKGTIGIEVPNQKPSIVSMKSVAASQKFQNAEMALPIAFGKTISNETFVVDLAKMPHLLMAGATGQGKSVGLNVILTSLLYQKHPAEVKFVLVDPKKVELTLFNKIERHYLAKLPDTEEAIITDNTKVINTLNSLCIEMDDRYELLKKAMVRNIREYNVKFKSRKLNPENGHRFLPYIVLVVDEFADLIMTAGKEVETPIARLAQLARAIGIHLIIATQRPSVNVITGMIKANFPARIAFRVTSKIDSRTILDAGGANQLIGRGDMLFTQGNEVIRLQCAFVDTPEIEKITDFIGSQKAYPDAYKLPEYVGEEAKSPLEDSIEDRDKLFKDAAEVIVTAQQGSASLLQRKLKLGYNRAGRIIDQLEAAGIVGQFEGSKARQVLVTDLNALDELLKNE
jgi:S-DNA-T family DNA segregation ATPase FtsK/SpoIIIE